MKSIPRQPNEMFADIVGFDWNSGNINKNLIRHSVEWKEGEEVFDNEPIIIALDTKHSTLEKRYQVLGKTNAQRKLFLVFTIRDNLFRIISIRDQNRKERIKYEQAI